MQLFSAFLAPSLHPKALQFGLSFIVKKPVSYLPSTEKLAKLCGQNIVVVANKAFMFLSSIHICLFPY